MGCYGCHSRSNVVGSQLVAHWIRHHIKICQKCTLRQRFVALQGAPKTCQNVSSLSSWIRHFHIFLLVVYSLWTKKKDYLRIFWYQNPPKQNYRLIIFRKYRKRAKMFLYFPLEFDIFTFSCWSLLIIHKEKCSFLFQNLTKWD